jgi:hypothetical protein
MRSLVRPRVTGVQPTPVTAAAASVACRLMVRALGRVPRCVVAKHAQSQPVILAEGCHRQLGGIKLRQRQRLERGGCCEKTERGCHRKEQEVGCLLTIARGRLLHCITTTHATHATHPQPSTTHCLHLQHCSSAVAPYSFVHCFRGHRLMVASEALNAVGSAGSNVAEGMPPLQM